MPQEAIFQPQPKQKKKSRQQEDSDDEEESSEEEEESDSESEDESAQLMGVLKAVFLAAKQAPEISLSQSQAPSLEEEIAKQRMLVQYLSDSVKCSRIIDRRWADDLTVLSFLSGVKLKSCYVECILLAYR